MANLSFAAAVERQVIRTKLQLQAVFQLAVQYTYDDMQLEGPSVTNPAGGRGGHMPIRTGFLRASPVASDTEPPLMRAGHSPPNPNALNSYQPGGEVALVISGAAIGDVIHIGYTADYAVFVEARYGFVRLAAQNWQQNVDKAVEVVKATVGAG